MCGRYALTLPPEAVRAYFGYHERAEFPGALQYQRRRCRCLWW